MKHSIRNPIFTFSFQSKSIKVDGCSKTLGLFIYKLKYDLSTKIQNSFHQITKLTKSPAYLKHQEDICSIG